jgi:PAS domain S-box-containing protein
MEQKANVTSDPVAVKLVTEVPRAEALKAGALGNFPLKTTHAIAGSLAGTALLVALGVMVSFWTFRQIQDAAEARKHAVVVISRGNEFLSELRDAETGQRGYSLTGDETFLEPYLAVRSNISRHLAELRQLTSISAGQEHLAALAPLVDAKLAELSRVIELRRNQDMAAVVAAVRGGAGKRLMDSIRVEMRGFIQLEEASLARREAQFQSNMRRLFIIIAAASLFTLLLALSFAYLMYRETQHRLRNQVHLETQHLLQLQKETNKQLHEANFTLQVSEEKLAVTLNSIGDAVIATDAEGRLTRLNPLAEELTGWTHAQAAGRPVNEIFHIINQETRQPAVVPVHDTLANGTIHGLANHTLLIALDGRERAIADSCAPIRDRDGQVVGAVLVFRDVTEEYAVQQALRDNAALIGTILNTVVDGIITFQASGGIVETANPAAERMFGYTAAELIGKNFNALIPELGPDQRNGDSLLQHDSASDQARASGPGREVVGRRKDGSTFPMEMAVSEMWLGGERYFTGILRDITARKQAEADLVEAGALQSAIFNSANFSSIATDAKGVIQIFNVGAERMLGYTAAEVLNQVTPAEISDPQEVIARAAALSVELGTPIKPGFEALVFKASRGIEDIYELSYIRKDGSRFPAVVSVTALRDAQDVIIGYLLIGTDNTARKQADEERKHAEEALRKSEVQLQTIVENLDEGVVVSDLQGQILHFNRAALDSHGYASLDEIRRHMSEFADTFELSDTDGVVIPPDQWPFARVLRGEKLHDWEVRIRRIQSGWQRVFSYGGTLVHDAGGQATMAVVTISDFTERKRFEQALQETNVKLESAKSVAEKANLAKSDFLSSMSHELRSPLNAILGFAQLMESASPSPSDAQTKSIAQILQAGWYLLKLINEVLDLAVIESGKISLSKEVVSLSELMSECHSMMEPQAQERGIRMSFPAFADPVFVTADRTRLKQIIINLVSNAIKYNREQGTVLVDCTLTSPPSPDIGAAGPARVRFSVQDTGAGLPPEKLAQLFTPFNRLGQEAGSVAGTGIGLVVSKRLAELMDGILGVESTVGVGSRFWCELNSAPAPEVAIPGGEAEPLLQLAASSDAPRRTLLYVEDNPANMQLVEQLIARFPDIGLVTAVNGTLGIELARATHPQVILMDINLPGISGIKALKILREDPITEHIPVIALSANAMARDVAKGLEAGFFRYLTKPIKITEFMDSLNEALEFAECKA